MRVRRSSGGARPEADHAGAPQWGGAHPPVCSILNGGATTNRQERRCQWGEGNRREGSMPAGRRWCGGASGSWIWEWGWRELSFIGNTCVKRKKYWLAWFRSLNSKGNIEGLKTSFTYKYHPSNCIWMVLTSSPGDSFLTWYFLVFPFLANYLWMTWLPLTKWRLFFLSLMCHQSHQSIFFTLYINISFRFEFLSISFLAMSSITQINFSCLEKRMKKGNNNHDCLRRLKKEWRKKTTSWLTGSSLLDLSLLTIYEWRGYHWQKDAVILSLVHLIT
jgi:hypothetical protein